MLKRQKQMSASLLSKKCCLICLVLVATMILIINTTAICQERLVYSEAPDGFKENGVFYATRLTVNFSEKVFELTDGSISASITDIPSSYPALKSAFIKLEKKYGKFSFRKKVPNAQWGDVWRKHRITGENVRVHEWSQLFSIEFDNFVPVDTVLQTIRSLAEVEYARGPIVAIADSDPNDPDYVDDEDLQWYLFQIETANAWNITKGNPDIRIGIMEFERPYTAHKDFFTGSGTSGNSKFDVTPTGSGGSNHPSRVAGLIGAATDDGDGIASLGWNLTMNAYAFNAQSGLVSEMNAAIDDECDVINCSFTLYSADFSFDGGCGCDIRDPLNSGDEFNDIKDIFADAALAGIVVIGTMANSGYNRIDNPEKPGCSPDDCDLVPFTPYPGAYDNVICITATDIYDDVPNNYNFGSFIDLSAPGINIFSTTIADTYNIENGSSFSAPLVSALAGLIRSVNPDLSISQVENVIESTADPISETVLRGGAGRINAYKALKYTLENYGGTVSGEVTITENLTIQSGNTLTVDPGTTIKFDSGVKLTINGTLDVKGLFANTVTFDRSGGSDWDGIIINSSSGSSSSITFATIINASTGLDINGASPTITNTKINNCGTGIFMQSGAAPKLTGNTITYNDYNGVACYGGAAPSFGVFPTWGDNVIRRNGDRGVYAAYSCTVFLGQNTTPPSGGRNSIYENYNANGYQISIRYGSTAMAEKNWWGSDPPSSGIFQDTWTIDYTPWWTGSDPHSSRPLTGAVNQDAETSPTANGNELSEADSLRQQLWQAFILYQKAKYDSAMQISRDIIKMAPSSDEAFSALNVLRISHVESGKPGMEGYLTQLIAKHAGEEVAGVARLNLAWYLLRKNRPAGALAQLQQNITSFSNNAIERITLFQKMVVYLLNLEDRKAAEAAFAELKAKYPDDLLVVEAQRLLGQSPPQNLQQQLTTFNAPEFPEDSIALSSYPNPFNPETRIQYQLFEASKVQIKIFNVAGQLVRSFEAGLQPAGVHSVVWDSKDNLGQQVSSGIYLYQLTAEPLSGSGERFKMIRKFTLMR